MLLEKAWAKVNRRYVNIEGGCQGNSMLTLTGFRGIYKELSEYNDKRYLLFDTIKKGIRKDGFLFGINTKGHAYSVLDAEFYRGGDKLYRVFKIRNPWGNMGKEDLTEEIQNNQELRRFIKIIDMRFGNKTV